MPRTYEIHYTDDTDAAVVENCSQDAAGVRFSDDEGNQVFVPWHRVDEIRSYLADTDTDTDDGLVVLRQRRRAVFVHRHASRSVRG